MLLSKTLRSSTLKLAFIYVILFSAAIFGLLGYVYWSTVKYLYEISDRAISVESVLLAKAYEAGGRDGLVEFINRRLTDVHFNDWVYLLVDHSFDYVAGNLKSWPAALRGHGGWSTIAAADWQSEAAKPSALRATYQVLPDGHHLLLGRDTDDLDRFGGARHDWSRLGRSTLFGPRRRCGYIHVAPFSGTDRSDQRDQPGDYAQRARRAHTIARDR